MSHITTPKNNATTGGGILFSMFILLTQDTYYLRVYLLLKRYAFDTQLHQLGSNFFEVR